MKEYLETRISELQKEYSDTLTKIGNEKAEEERKCLWKIINDKKSRLDELKDALKFFNENNYTNL